MQNNNLTVKVASNKHEVYYQELDKPLDNVNITLEEAASLEILIYNSKCNFKASVAKDAELKIYNIIFTDQASSNNYLIDLDETGASTHVINVYLGVKDAKLNTDIYINHKAMSTKSLLETYAISLNQATLLLNNNAKIEQGMHASDARQQTKGLNLGTGSITAKPNLFIDEYDVVASHSASIGSINQEELFYLMSRGLTLTDATQIIIIGFIKPLLSQIKDLKLQENIYNNFIEYLK